MIMKSYVADELSNKVYHLNKALKQAQDIIAILEKENNRLRDALIDLASLKKEDYSQLCELLSDTKPLASTY